MESKYPERGPDSVLRGLRETKPAVAFMVEVAPMWT